MFPVNPRTRTMWRWGGALAALLILQTLVLASVFWLLATQSRVAAAETGLKGDCREFALMEKGERMEELRQALDRDVHRERFLALVDADGTLLEGNVAHLPPGPPPARSAVATIETTELPGKHRDEVRYAICVFADGSRLMTAVDLDDSQYADRIVARASVLALIPGLLLSLAIGLVAGRRAARQVEAVRLLTRRIVAGTLSERLPVSDTRADSFGLLCREINAMLDRLAVLIADVRGIGDDIAHQIRTPLTRLRARIERAASAEADGGVTPLAPDLLADVDKMLGIVAALLRIRELEDQHRRSRFAPVDLAVLIDDACDLYRPAIEDAGGRLEYRVETRATVTGDASLLMEAVTNLIDNAGKFGPADGVVTVHLDRDGDVPMITVADEGTGVPPQERRLVTQRFYRSRRDCDGIGLGLSLVNAIVDLHGFGLRFADAGSAVSIVCTIECDR